MKSFQPLVAALFVGNLSRAQDVSCLEICGEQLIDEALAAGCDQDDIACICRNETIALNFRDCSYAQCTDVSEAEDGVVGAYTACADVGVELTIPLAPEGFPDPQLPPDCLETCILRIVDIGVELGCEETDFECFCNNQETIGPPLVECAYSECQGENEVAAVEEYASQACEFAEIPITVPVSPTTPTTPPATPTADATEDASPTSPPPAAFTGGAASNAAPGAGLAAVGIAALLV